jgi:DNA-binding NarL/FixJ family response regulator
MQAEHLLVLTQNAQLRKHWSALTSVGWTLVHGETLQSLHDWKAQGRQWVILDAALTALPSWDDDAWYAVFQNAKVVVLSAHPDDEAGHRILGHGASGYAHANSSLESLQAILKTISDGGIWMGRNLLQRLLHDVGQRLPHSQALKPAAEAANAWANGLTQREQEVAQLAALGDSNAAIAAALHISERTVRAHLSAIFEKLQVADRLMLALKVHGVRK